MKLIGIANLPDGRKVCAAIDQEAAYFNIQCPKQQIIQLVDIKTLELVAIMIPDAIPKDIYDHFDTELEARHAFYRAYANANNKTGRPGLQHPYLNLN